MIYRDLNRKSMKNEKNDLDAATEQLREPSKRGKNEEFENSWFYMMNKLLR